MKKRTDIAGFTLIELLVAMVILGILTVISLGNFSSTQQKARDGRRKADLQNVTKVLEAYYNDYGQYPSSSAESVITDPSATSVGGKIQACTGEPDPFNCEWGQPMQDDRGTLYTPQLPVDPKSFEYFYVSDGSSYQLYARLENDKDRDIAKQGEAAAAYENTDCGAQACNYGVASTNSSLATVVSDY